MICKFHFRLNKETGEPLKNVTFCRDVTKIENYSKAVLDTTQVWECHHRLETHYLERGRWVRREQEVSMERLIEDGKYFDVPPEELIFLTHEEHFNPKLWHKAWNSGKRWSEEAKQKMSEAHKGKKAPWITAKRSKPVQCIETGEVFESSREAERKTGFFHSLISKSIKTGKPYKGYHWAYAPTEIED